jgi:hypothetical protein
VPLARLAAAQAALAESGSPRVRGAPAADGEYALLVGRRTRRAGSTRGRGPGVLAKYRRRATSRRPVGGHVQIIERGAPGGSPVASSSTACNFSDLEAGAARAGCARGALTERSPSLVDVARGRPAASMRRSRSRELQLAARVDGIEQQDVRDALWRDRTLVKAGRLRGRCIFHPASELPLWFAPDGPR